jgi:hypothetical protein
MTKATDTSGDSACLEELRRVLHAHQQRAFLYCELDRSVLSICPHHVHVLAMCPHCVLIMLLSSQCILIVLSSFLVLAVRLHCILAVFSCGEIGALQPCRTRASFWRPGLKEISGSTAEELCHLGQIEELQHVLQDSVPCATRRWWSHSCACCRTS